MPLVLAWVPKFLVAVLFAITLLFVLAKYIPPIRAAARVPKLVFISVLFATVTELLELMKIPVLKFVITQFLTDTPLIPFARTPNPDRFPVIVNPPQLSVTLSVFIVKQVPLLLTLFMRVVLEFIVPQLGADAMVNVKLSGAKLLWPPSSN